ncbi:hypothetical protein EV361DRAFT_870206 [Lentinula raphanica]|nr:hypothetical protein EV361DRAFT_870206 [Lentinula raphanica]
MTSNKTPPASTANGFNELMEKKINFRGKRRSSKGETWPNIQAAKRHPLSMGKIIYKICSVFRNGHNCQRGPSSNIGTRKRGKANQNTASASTSTGAQDRNDTAPATPAIQSTSAPSGTYRPRPRPIPLTKGTPAYEHRPGSHLLESSVETEVEAALQLIGLQNQTQPGPTANTQAKSMWPSESEDEETTGDAPLGQFVIEDDEEMESHSDTSSEPKDEAKKAWNNLVQSVEKFNIVFEVPYKTLQCNLTGITSHTPFNKFINALAWRMDTRLTLLSNISYLPSYKPKAWTTDVMLEGEDDWIMLIRDAWDHMQNT